MNKIGDGSKKYNAGEAWKKGDTKVENKGEGKAEQKGDKDINIFWELYGADF